MHKCRYFDALYGFCRLGRVDRIQKYIENPIGMQKAMEEKDIGQVVAILQSLFYVIQAANASLLDTELSYFVPWLQLAQCVQYKDVQRAMEYFVSISIGGYWYSLECVLGYYDCLLCNGYETYSLCCLWWPTDAMGNPTPGQLSFPTILERMLDGYRCWFTK